MKELKRVGVAGLTAAILWTVVALPVGAQNATIAEMSAGYFMSTGENETTLVSRNDDPPKHRMGVMRNVLGTLGGRGLGALSWNVVDQGGREDEHVLVQGKRTDFGGGEFYLGLKKPHGGSGDADMDDVLVVTHQDGFRFNLPIYAPNLNGGVSTEGAPFILRHPNGRTWLALQGDGNFVAYVNLERGNYNTGFPIWASGTVFLNDQNQPTKALQDRLAEANAVWRP